MIRLLLLREDRISYISKPDNIMFRGDKTEFHNMYCIDASYSIDTNKLAITAGSHDFSDWYSDGRPFGVFNCPLDLNDTVKQYKYFYVYPKELQ